LTATVAVTRRHRHRNTEAESLSRLGWGFRELGRLDEAVARHQEALTVVRETGDRPTECEARNEFGLTLRATEEVSGALEQHRMALGEAIKLGLKYEHARALDGIAGWEVSPHHIETPSGARILEVPVAILTLGAWRLPVAGGGYFRVLPAALLERALRAITAQARPAVVYCHPYEFSADELGDYRGAVDAKVLVAQGIGRRSVTGRVSALLERLPFGRFDRVLSAWGLT
jgi:hypothetical protein